MGRKLWRENGNANFFVMCLVGWGGRKINGGVQLFSSMTHKKIFFLKWRENWKEKLHIIFGRKFTLFFLRVFFFLNLLGKIVQYYYFLFCFLLCVCVCVFFFFKMWFFYGHDFYFLINLVIEFFFFFCLSLFLVLIGHHFLTEVYA